MSGLLPESILTVFLGLLLITFSSEAVAQAGTVGVNAKAASAKFNRSEAAVPPYVEPDPLRLSDGRIVRDQKTWYGLRRPELLSLLSNQMFGRTPTRRLHLRIESTEMISSALEGRAIRKQITLRVSGLSSGPKVHILLYIPKSSKAPVPVILGLNYGGNQSVSNDPGISLGTVWIPDADNHLKEHAIQADDSTRGSAASQWPIVRLLAAGYAFATVYDGDFEPDFEGGITYGFRPLFFAPGQTEPANDDWGSIGVWAWGLSRVADVLGSEKSIDRRRMIVIGHSRLGKAVLWAGAQDTRFAAVISNESGKGGAALMKRDFGETVAHLNERFPYWFCRNFRRYSTNTASMPFDSPLLLALVAPRPLYIASADGDYTLDARGEFLAASEVGGVYALLGTRGLEAQDMPAVDKPLMNTVGYHDRTGKHDMTPYDWDQYLAFLDRVLHSNRSIR